MDITTYIKATRDSFITNNLAPNAYEINNGLCEEFAMSVIGVGFGIALWQDELDQVTPLTWGEVKEEIEGYCHHCFILYNGKFYDAECPEGVTHPKDLPLFKKHIRYFTQKLKTTSICCKN